MADLKAWPLNLEEYYYNAEDVQRWMAGKTSGVYGAEENWQVAAKSGMTVTVKAQGMVGGWLSNMGKYGITFWNENDIDLTVETADGVNPRIDRVVVSWRIPQQTTLPTVSIRKGTPASSPKGAALVNDGEYAEICLAEITVAAGATSISSANIRDTRLDESLCGLVSVGLERIPTDALYQEFIDWFENVKATLEGDVAGNLQRQIDERLKKTGDTMTGPLSLSGDPTENLHAAPKQYVDQRVKKSGDTMTGDLVLPATAQTSARAHNISLTTVDLEAGVTALPNGEIRLVYE